MRSGDAKVTRDGRVVPGGGPWNVNDDGLSLCRAWTAESDSRQRLRRTNEGLTKAEHLVRIHLLENFWGKIGWIDYGSRLTY